MNKSEKLGKLGEFYTGKYLKDKGYKIICFNYHSKYGEIDIISENDKYTVFVEVKTRSSFNFSRGVEAVNSSKKKRILKTALSYLGENKIFRQPRFDIAEVWVNKKNEYKINYLENAFDMEEFGAFF